MRVGVPKETAARETRVALIPAGVATLKKAGLEVVVETGAGDAAGFPDTVFREIGSAHV
jgi:alanine dehydrogenase